MRGDKTYKVLDWLGDLGRNGGDIVTAFLRAGYGASLKKIGYELKEIEKRRYWREVAAEEKRLFNSLIYKLKRDGLVKKEVKKDGKYNLSITAKGLAALREIRRKPNIRYRKTESKRLTIVIFDIPEEQRGKRDRLRETLINLGFKMSQKSVWIGRIKIPRELIEDLREQKIIKYVEIFEATRLGTLGK